MSATETEKKDELKVKVEGTTCSSKTAEEKAAEEKRAAEKKNEEKK